MSQCCRGAAGAAAERDLAPAVHGQSGAAGQGPAFLGAGRSFGVREWVAPQAVVNAAAGLRTDARAGTLRSSEGALVA